VWPVATYGCESWTLRKNEETRLEAFENLRVSWTTKKTDELVLNKAGVKRKLVDTQRKEASIQWSCHEETRELPGERNNIRNTARCTQARKTTHGMDRQHQDMDRTPSGKVNQNETGYRDKWRKYVHGVANPRIEDG